MHGRHWRHAASWNESVMSNLHIPSVMSNLYMPSIESHLIAQLAHQIRQCRHHLHHGGPLLGLRGPHAFNQRNQRARVPLHLRVLAKGWALLFLAHYRDMIGE